MAGFIEPGAGEMDRRIELLRRTQAASGSDGMATGYTAADPPKAWARVKTLFGGRVIEGKQEIERVSHVFTIRWRGDWRGGAWDTVRYDGRIFKVQSVEDPGERKAFLEILAEEEQDA